MVCPRMGGATFQNISEQGNDGRRVSNAVSSLCRTAFVPKGNRRINQRVLAGMDEAGRETHCRNAGNTLRHGKALAAAPKAGRALSWEYDYSSDRVVGQDFVQSVGDVSSQELIEESTGNLASEFAELQTTRSVRIFIE